MFSDQKYSSKGVGIKAAWVLALPVLLLLTTGCGGSAKQSTGTPAGNGDPGIPIVFSVPPSVTTPLQVRLGGDPSEQILSCDLNITSITLKSSADPSVAADLLFNPNTIEFTRLAQTLEPIGLLDTAQGTYDQVEIKIAGATVAYLDAAGRTRTQTVSTSLTTLVTPDRPIVIGDIPTILNIDIDLSKTVQLAVVSNKITLKGPVVTVNQMNIAGPGGLPSSTHSARTYTHATPSSGQLTSQNGGVERLTGVASEIQADEFTLTTGTAQLPLQVHFDGNSTFENVSPTSLDGALVEVEGWTQPDGSIYGDEVEGLSPGTGTEVEGFLVGSSASLRVVAQDAIGTGASTSLIGTEVSAMLNTGVNYAVNSGDEDLAGLPVTFDGKHVFPGQRVEVESYTGLVKSANQMQIQPYEVELLHQTVSGTVSNYTIGSTWMPEFDLTLSSNSYLRILNRGTGTVHVYQRSTTDLSRLTSDIQDGSPLTVRGFLFCADSNDTPRGRPLQFELVASSVTDLQ
jgi:hypothetical protein